MHSLLSPPQSLRGVAWRVGAHRLCDALEVERMVSAESGLSGESLIGFLSNLNQAELDRLYSDPWTCQASVEQQRQLSNRLSLSSELSLLSLSLYSLLSLSTLSLLLYMYVRSTNLTFYS